jgi:signal transduction histidine kinase
MLGSQPAGAGPPALPVRRWAERRTIVLSAAVLVFAGVCAWRVSSGDVEETIDLLFVIPVALVALELGLRAGLVAAALAIAAVGGWTLGADADIGAIGFLTRASSLLAVAGIAGRFADHQRAAQRRQRMLLQSGLRLAHLDAADDLPAILARDARALASACGARVELGDRRAQAGAGEHLGEAVPIELRGVRIGRLAVGSARGVGPQDRVALEILALQAAVAEENRRLLEQERERAAMRAELSDARASLERRARQLEGLVARQEEERSQVAYELHENAAQMLAAVLLGLGALEHQPGPQLPGPALGELRWEVDATLQSLRALAGSLRPPSLALGLGAALEGLAARAAADCDGEMTVSLEADERLDAEAETMIYRVVEEALGAVGGACAIAVSGGGHSGQLDITVKRGSRPIDGERLTVLSARLELAGGTLEVGEDQLRAVIPLRVPRSQPRGAGAPACGVRPGGASDAEAR